MKSYALLAVLSLAVGCSPRVIDAVVADESCCDAGADVAVVVEASSPPTDVVEAAAAKLLVHRYSFAGPAGATRVPDATGNGGDALIYNVPQGLSGLGYLELPGGRQPVTFPAYVDLPNFLISRLNTVTIEAWVDWRGPATTTAPDAWQRIFDFGEDFSGADLDASARIVDPNKPHDRDGRSYLYLTPMAGDQVPPVLRLGYLKPEDSVPRESGVTLREATIEGTAALTAGLHQLDVTVDANGRMLLYVDGNASAPFEQLPGKLADIYDVNCWLGRSQFPADSLLQANYYDFRIYSTALTPAQIQLNKAATAANLGVQ